MLEGTNTRWKTNQWMILFLPLIYFIRRLTMILTSIFWPKFFFGQIVFQYVVSLSLIIFIQLTKPLDSKFANWMETFNEGMTLIFLYILMSLTEFVPIPEDRDMVGDYYIGLVLFFVSFHSLFILIAMV